MRKMHNKVCVGALLLATVLAIWMSREAPPAPVKPDVPTVTSLTDVLPAASKSDTKRSPAQRTYARFKILLENGMPAARARMAIAKLDQPRGRIPFVTASEEGIADLPISPGNGAGDLRVVVLWRDAHHFPKWLDTRLDLEKLPEDQNSEIELRFPELSRLKIQLVGPDGSFLAREAVTVNAFLPGVDTDPAYVAFCSMSSGEFGRCGFVTDDLGEIEICGVSPQLTLYFGFSLPGIQAKAISRVETNLMPHHLPGYFHAKPEGEYFVRVIRIEMPVFEVQVVDDRDNPVPGADVSFYLGGPTDGKEYLHTGESGFTDQNGSLKIRLAAKSSAPSRLEGSPWWIAGFSPKFGAGYAKGTLSLQARTGKVRLVPADNRPVRGRLISQENGEPMPGIEIELRSFFHHGRGALARTNEKGEFEFAYVMPPPENWRPPGAGTGWKLEMPSDSVYEFAQSSIVVEGKTFDLGGSFDTALDLTTAGDYKIILKK